MAQAEREIHNGSAIDTMLRGLTERPNVQSTLILSKKDGSIIRASGLIATENQLPSGTSAPYQWSRTQQADRDTTIGQESDQSSKSQEESETQQEKQQPMEVLAASIFQFVNHAAALSLTLGGISRDVGMAGTSSYRDSSASNQEVPAEGDAPWTKDDEVQLLRLRTKYQEIIVFPDPNYICCVVQRVGKGGSNADRR